MALDVYVGSLTRYYRHEWENVAQKWAKEQGIQYNIVHAGGKPEPPLDASSLQQAVRNWCGELQLGLRNNISMRIIWNESQEAPYFTDRPSWDGYCGLLLLASYAEHPDLVPPDALPKKWSDNPAYQRSTAPDFHSSFSQILRPSLWIPIDFKFTFDAGTLSREKATIGSTFELHRQLSRLEDIVKKRFPEPERLSDSKESPSLARMGNFGLQIFLKLAQRACENKLPMLTDY